MPASMPTPTCMLVPERQGRLQRCGRDIKWVGLAWWIDAVKVFQSVPDWPLGRSELSRPAHPLATAIFSASVFFLPSRHLKTPMLELRSKEPHSINQLPKAVELCVVTLNLECAQGLTTALPGPRGLLGWSCPISAHSLILALTSSLARSSRNQLLQPWHVLSVVEIRILLASRGVDAEIRLPVALGQALISSADVALQIPVLGVRVGGETRPSGRACSESVRRVSPEPGRTSPSRH